MKLLYLVNGILGSGGLEKVLAIKTKGLIHQKGHKIYIVSMFEEEGLPFFQLDPAVHLRFLNLDTGGIGSWFKMMQALGKSIQEIDPQIVSVCDDGLKALVLPWTLDRKRIWVYERHATKGFLQEKSSSWKKLLRKPQNWLMDRLASRFDRVVVLTQGNQQEWKLNNTVVIPNAVEQSAEGLSDLESPIVLAVGKQGIVKGYDRLLTVWSRLHKRFPEWKLQIVGKFNPRLNLETIKEELGLMDSVQFIPPDPQINAYYRAASVYVMTSRSEGFGMVLIEAMQHGVPVVAFDCPYGPADIIDDDLNGYLVADGDLDAFAARLEVLMSQPDKRRSMGREAALKSQTYGAGRVVGLWDELYHQLIK